MAWWVLDPGLVRQQCPSDGIAQFLPKWIGADGQTNLADYVALMAMAHQLTDASKGVYGFVGRGLKNANMTFWDDILLKWDQETVTPDGKKLLTDTPAAIEAATWYQKIMRECAPPGVIGFNWNECQTTFMQGRAAMWWDGIGFSAPLVDPNKSKVVGKVGFAPDPAGKVRNCATFIDGIGIPATAKNKKPAWLFVQWVIGKKMLNEVLRTGSGTPARLSCYGQADMIKEAYSRRSGLRRLRVA